MSKIGEFILHKLSRDPNSLDYVWAEHVEQRLVNVTAATKRMENAFPNFKNAVSGRNVFDIGCSGGIESIAISLLGAREVVGIDINLDLEQAKALKKELAPNNFIEFYAMDAHKTIFPDNRFDTIITLSSFEHFNNPYGILEESRRILKKGGRIFLTSGVWASPYGAHMRFFTKIPWVQFFFSEETIMNVRGYYRNDGAKKFSEVKGGLNKIGIRKLMQYIHKLDFEIEYLSLTPVKKLTYLTHIPVFNEFFSNGITAILKK